MEKYKFYDVLSTEDWAIDMIPKPIKAFMLLYPLSDAQEKVSHLHSHPFASCIGFFWLLFANIPSNLLQVRAEENQRLTANGCTSMDGVYFTEQVSVASSMCSSVSLYDRVVYFVT